MARFRFGYRAFSFLGVLLALGILVVSLLALWSDRQDDWDRATRSGNNLRVTLTSDISRSVRMYDLALEGAAQALRAPGFAYLGNALRHQMLFSRAAATDYLGSILVLDANGDIMYESGSIEPREANFADRAYFYVHKQNPDVGLYISKPFASRMRGGDASIAFSRRLFNPDGSFSGVVMGAMRLAYFRDKFSQLALGPDSALALLREDGILIVRDPYDERDVGRDLSAADTVKRFRSAPSGTFVGVASVDGKERLFSFGRIGDLPLLLSVGVSTREVLAPWRRKTLVLAPITLALCTAVAALSFLFQRELLRRRRAQAELALLASTDALTGLPNRRRFDEVYAREWVRAHRMQASLALLFIDADNFKSFNDHYGHGVGDVLLKKIATGIADSIRAPGDFVARYGGEEFIAILPDTQAAEALRIAERICASIPALAVPHVGTLSGVATVSIGVAAARPVSSLGRDALLAQADAALYLAKGRGRGRVAVIDA